MDGKEFKKLYPDINKAEISAPSDFDKPIECQDIVDLIDSLSFPDLEKLAPESREIIESYRYNLMKFKESLLNSRRSKLAIENKIANKGKRLLTS